MNVMQKPNPERQTQPFNAKTHLPTSYSSHRPPNLPLNAFHQAKAKTPAITPSATDTSLTYVLLAPSSYPLNSSQKEGKEERPTLTDLPSTPPVTVGKVVFVPATPALALPLGTTTVLSLDVCVVVVFAGALTVTFVEIDFAVAVGVMIAAGVEVGMDVGGETRVGIATAWC
jgi:hypothetical protein